MTGQLLHVQAAPTCLLCITELSTHGVNGEEDQDYLIIANGSGAAITASSTYPMQLRYYNEQGVLSGSANIATTTIAKDQVYVLVSSALQAVNTTASSLSLPLFSGGGSLQLSRTTGTTTQVTTVYDRVTWGSGIATEGQKLPTQDMLGIFVRKRSGTAYQDTDNNVSDFYEELQTCQGASITEIQPSTIDAGGKAIDAWVELLGVTSLQGDCIMLTKAGDVYSIPAADMPAQGMRTTINRGIVSGSIDAVPLHLGEKNGQIWLAGHSFYSDPAGVSVHLPFTSQAYSNIESGQSWANVDGVWRRTYTPTPDGVNIFTAAPTVEGDDPVACSMVKITEVLPNPNGEDAAHEWLELTNEADEIVSLAHCSIVVGDVAYTFLPDDVLGGHEIRYNYDFYDANGVQKQLNLKNTGETLIALARLKSDGTSETVQSFMYTDAPDGQSWARYSDGWRWDATPTPGQDNTTTPDQAPSGATEGPAPSPTEPAPSSSGGNYAHLTITELLPNPAAPQTDDQDEFVELYNPNDAAVLLAGYKLQVGNNYSYSFTFDTQSIEPKSYFVVTSGTSSISLANSGGRARLLDPAGNVLCETDPYVNAPEGESWAYVDGKWQWTSSTTSAAENIFMPPLVGALAKTKAVNSSPKKASTAPKVGSTKAKTGSGVKSAKVSTKTGAATTASASSASKAPLIHIAVLASVGLLAVLYAAYEYRTDIANAIYKLRRNRADRRAHRQATKGR